MNIEEFKQKVNELDSGQKYDEILVLCDNQLAEINSGNGNNKEFLADIYYAKGFGYFLKEEYQFAIEYFNKAIKLKPDLTEAYCNRGNTKYDLGQYSEAIEDFNKAIELNPDFSEAYYRRGRTKFILNQYEDAIEDYTKAIELDPDNSNIYYHRGLANRKLKQYIKAILDYKKAFELSLNCAFKMPPILLAIGVIFVVYSIFIGYASINQNSFLINNLKGSFIAFLMGILIIFFAIKDMRHK